MSEAVTDVRPARPAGRGPAIAVTLVAGLLAALLLNWAAGAAVLLLGLVLAARPFDPFVAILLVSGVSAFAEYGDPNIQRDLAITGLLTVYAMASIFLAVLGRRWRAPEGGLSKALLLLAVTTALGALHGVLAHHSIRFIALEVFPLFSLLFALAVAGLHPGAADRRLAGRALVVVGLVSAAIGYQYFATTGMRTQGLPYTPVPGMIAVVVLARELFDPAPRPRWGSLVIFAALLGHQVLTFTRGYWLALLVSIPFVVVLYLVRGPGMRGRWAKLLRTSAVLGVFAIGLGVVASAVLGWTDVVGMLGSRFFSSFETKDTPETVSNIVRLVELRVSLKAIAAQPLFGYGHGSTLIVRQSFYPLTGPQWWVHESYVMIWLKQGVLGLLALLWVIGAAIRTGTRGSRSANPDSAGWAAAAAGATVFTAVVCLTNYHFFMVTLTFLLALLWGLALADARPSKGRIAWPRFVWRRRVPTAPGPSGPA